MRDDGRVPDDDLLRAAADELYAADLDGFTDRRKELAAAARAAGEPAAAKEIAALRKPTRSAWAVNQLVRADPAVPARLSGLAGDLRAAEAALDGPRIRELSQARRELVDALVRKTLSMTGEPGPSAALAEEVTAIFGAALADPQVAAQLAAGTLVRAEQRAGFGSGFPALAVVPEPAPRPARKPSPAASETPSAPAGGRTARAASAQAQAASRGARGEPSAGAKAGAKAGTAEARAGTAEARAQARAEAAAAKAQARAEAAAAAAEARARAAAAAAAEAEHERRRALAEAEHAAADASRAVDAAATAVRDWQVAVRRIEEQLTEAREALAEARVDARQAENAQRRAQQTLDRLRR
jgi:hypothetical protein